MGGKREGVPHENLHSYLHFLAWCQQAGQVNSSQVHLLKDKAAADPQKALSVLGEALELREAIYRIFMDIINAATPGQVDLARLNFELARALGRLRIKQRMEGSGFDWEWSDESVQLESPLGPVAQSAATLLASDNLLARLHQCGGENCGWLFVDTSKNHSRRWCDMRDCGNRAKVRRHRQKSRPSDDTDRLSRKPETRKPKAE
jgi:predicted RNA-binding Zn ribbon-like protein